jgi:para-nitrobenzyl esterase
MGGPATVSTASGVVVGYELCGVRVFKGVPYASAGRFGAPQPPPSWSGVLDVTTFGPAAPQLRVRQGLARPGALGALLNWPENEVHSETDCLAANVWTPAEQDERGRPVFVYIHGGQYVTGSGSWRMYDGTRLAAEHDVVVVTFNYRLGILGLVEYGEDVRSATELGPHAGFLDQIALLKWVRENIAAFGGDPSNITVGGSMAGGDSVLYLMTAPPARGLFHKAFIRGIDANVVRGRTRERADAAVTVELIARELGSEKDLQALRSVPLDLLLGAQSAVMHREFARASMSPYVDGSVIAEPPVDALARGASADVPLLLGCTRDEAMLTLPGWSWGGDDRKGGPQVPALDAQFSAEVVDAYRQAEPNASDAELLVRMKSDFDYRMPLRIVTAHREAAAASTYAYLFCRRTPALGLDRAVHALDVPYWFSTVNWVPLVGDGADALRLAKPMSASLAAFARSGSPACAALPEWPEYDDAHRRTMLLDDVARVEDDPYPMPQH